MKKYRILWGLLLIAFLGGNCTGVMIGNGLGCHVPPKRGRDE